MLVQFQSFPSVSYINILFYKICLCYIDNEMRYVGLFGTELLKTLDVCQSNISLPWMLFWQTLNCYYYFTRNSCFFPSRICCYFLSVFVQEFAFLCVFSNCRISLSLSHTPLNSLGTVWCKKVHILFLTTGNFMSHD